MSVKNAVVVFIMAAALFLPRCTSEGDESDREITFTVYSGQLVDSVVAVALGLNYSRTIYRYTICSNDSFALTEDVGVGSELVETGTYSVFSTIYSFVPKFNRIRNLQTKVLEDSRILRGNYSGTLNGISLTIPAFVDVDGKRIIGNLIVKKE